MQEQLKVILDEISSFVWGVPTLILLVGVGIYLTFLLKGLQFRRLWHSLWLGLIKRKEKDAPGDISHFQALMTALAATVGTGNIAGVATAISIGGPGALFWMWITGLFGMATKYAEAILAVKYRVVDEKGQMSGGPMYYISKGLNMKWLGAIFAVFASIAAFGIGNMVQSNSVADAVNHTFNVPVEITGIIMTVATALVIIGGIKSIGRVTEIFVPIMIVFYVAASLYVVVANITEVPRIIMYVLVEAFTPTAATGGFAGAAVLTTIRMGVARGVFSNESGLGSSPIAAAAAQTKNPVSQALVSMSQTFIDTIVICSLTGFAILVTGVWNNGQTGVPLTSTAFSTALPGTWGGIVVSLGIMLFAYSTILGWSYYGEKSVEFLLGIKSVMPYRVLFTIAVFIGAVSKLEIVWSFADIMNGLMAIPNLIGLIGLSGIVAAETKKHFDGKNN
ncbi:MAG TPA: sodium:alanine symporter family protein [Ignavibacteriales bacterium]|nr:sodium:alanine symporter family protein [Ignavibacteriales bacterium]